MISVISQSDCLALDTGTIYTRGIIRAGNIKKGKPVKTSNGDKINSAPPFVSSRIEIIKVIREDTNHRLGVAVSFLPV